MFSAASTAFFDLGGKECQIEEEKILTTNSKRKEEINKKGKIRQVKKIDVGTESFVGEGTSNCDCESFRMRGSRCVICWKSFQLLLFLNLFGVSLLLMAGGRTKERWGDELKANAREERKESIITARISANSQWRLRLISLPNWGFSVQIRASYSICWVIRRSINLMFFFKKKRNF